jgi:hypothetical protein
MALPLVTHLQKSLVLVPQPEALLTGRALLKTPHILSEAHLRTPFVIIAACWTWTALLNLNHIR